MKDKSIKLAKSYVYSPQSQCYGKKQYKYKRRAIKDAQSLSLDTGETFTVYECPHCGKYHVGSARI